MEHDSPSLLFALACERPGRYVLDEIMGNATDPPITEHAPDTHGVTLVTSGPRRGKFGRRLRRRRR